MLTLDSWPTDSREDVLALLQLEHALRLLRVADDRDDDLVEQVRRHFDQLEVTVVDGIEGPRIEDSGHGSAPGGRANVTTVPPYLLLLVTSRLGSTSI